MSNKVTLLLPNARGETRKVLEVLARGGRCPTFRGARVKLLASELQKSIPHNTKVLLNQKYQCQNRASTPIIQQLCPNRALQRKHQRVTLLKRPPSQATRRHRRVQAWVSVVVVTHEHALFLTSGIRNIAQRTGQLVGPFSERAVVSTSCLADIIFILSS